MSAQENFRAAMRAAGLEYAGIIEADGRLHRFKAVGDHARNSWYVVYPTPPMAGAFGCWKRGLKETYVERRSDLSPAERQAAHLRWQEAERARKQVEDELHQKARKTAAWILGRAKPVTDQHPYLSGKSVKLFGDLREWQGALVLPLLDAGGDLQSLQFIRPDGGKRFLTGGRVAGCQFAIGGQQDGPLVLCEGYATGASIREATGFEVVCAMHSGNLHSIAEGQRQKHPRREIIVAADNDQFTEGNPGVTKATAAARAIHAKLAVPLFSNLSAHPTDFNDLHGLAGLAEVARQIHAVVMAAGVADGHVSGPSNAGSMSVTQPAGDPDDPEAAPFPLDALPPAMATIIAGVAKSERVPVELPAICAFGVISAAIGAGLETASGPNRFTRGNLYLLGSAESGSGKSETFRVIAAPLLEYQARMLETWRLVTSPKFQSEIRVIEKEIALLEKKAAKVADPVERDHMLAELQYKLARKDELTSQAAMPCIIAQDITTERLAVALRDNREVLLSASADARKLVDNLLGRYSPGKMTDESLYLSAYSGDFVRVDRQGRDAVVLNKPCLSLCWLIQPDLLAILLDESSLSASGFLPRLLVCDTRAVPRKIEAEAQVLAESVRNQWVGLIRDLLATFHAADKPYLITPAPDALKFLNNFHNRVVDRRAADLVDVGAFAARYAENAWRLAVVLHAAHWGANAASEALAAETAANAVRLMEWFAGQQLAILAKGRRAAATKTEDEVLELLDHTKKRQHRDYISARDVHRARLVATADAAPGVLERMEADGVLCGEDVTPPKGGRTTRIYRRSTPALAE